MAGDEFDDFDYDDFSPDEFDGDFEPEETDIEELIEEEIEALNDEDFSCIEEEIDRAEKFSISDAFIAGSLIGQVVEERQLERELRRLNHKKKKR